MEGFGASKLRFPSENIASVDDLGILRMRFAQRPSPPATQPRASQRPGAFFIALALSDRGARRRWRAARSTRQLVRW